MRIDHDRAVGWVAHAWSFGVVLDECTAGMGHVYQGRFKSFPVASDEHLLAVLRYVERNPLRAGLVDRAEDYAWGSLRRRLPEVVAPQEAMIPLAVPPIPLPRNWGAHVNQPQNEAEVLAVADSIRRGRPYGSETWQHKVAKQLHLESTFRPRGRPKKEPASEPSNPQKGSRPTPVRHAVCAYPY